MGCTEQGGWALWEEGCAHDVIAVTAKAGWLACTSEHESWEEYLRSNDDALPAWVGICRRGAAQAEG
jgi:hypothetical protein